VRSANPQASFLVVRRAMMNATEKARARLSRDQIHSGECG
jgi:hypothetical protein